MGLPSAVVIVRFHNKGPGPPWLTRGRVYIKNIKKKYQRFEYRQRTDVYQPTRQAPRFSGHQSRPSWPTSRYRTGRKALARLHSDNAWYFCVSWDPAALHETPTPGLLLPRKQRRQFAGSCGMAAGRVRIEFIPAEIVETRIGKRDGKRNMTFGNELVPGKWKSAAGANWCQWRW
ncbi:hypothetical protein BD289DRAFT_447736 [Coniella lustricola]|uniref:Uncharacterized protein n=1 Tax=Coniella lustricola TaxID=2025994 RepID=A0A2T2ZST1_9PEZI|nr:hypothetical protein BD289DRAFT_447736 [Coniella lustricola]